MADIFISYAREDRSWVKTLVDALEAEGWSVWWDLHLRSGEAFDEAIERTIRQVHCVITVWSTHSVRSKWVRAETAWARDHDKLVCVRRDEDCEIPIQFYLTHADSLAGWDGTRSSPLLRKVVDDVAALAGRPGVSSVLPKPLSVFRDRLPGGHEGPEMVVIPAGSFQMGSAEDEADRFGDEEPIHRVTFVRPFAMGRCPVTFEDYDRFVAATGHGRPDDRGWGRGRRPVIQVSWENAQAYCVWLSEQTGQPYRLPSEAEWEYAARAGTTTAYWWGNEVGRNNANCNGCGSPWDDKQTAPVGSFAPNPFGLYDTAGNVWEWVQDCWHGSYAGAPDDGAPWTSDCQDPAGRSNARVLRGGSWGNHPGFVRSANRYRRPAANRSTYVGFRLARSI